MRGDIAACLKAKTNDAVICVQGILPTNPTRKGHPLDDRPYVGRFYVVLNANKNEIPLRLTEVLARLKGRVGCSTRETKQIGYVPSDKNKARAARTSDVRIHAT